MTAPGTELPQVAIAISACGVACIWVLIRCRLGLRARSGTRRTTVLASDTGAAASLVLHDPRLGLSGKPDYVLRDAWEGREQLVALELKPNRRGSRVFESDAIQVAAYALLLRATYGDRAARFGYLQTQSHTVRVELTPALTRRVEEVVRLIRRGRLEERVHRSHTARTRCARCGLRAWCDERLV
ncbi:MAG: PD-(D/E)XK nuclease family protein [Gemmatimonadaceae bacterium]